MRKSDDVKRYRTTTTGHVRRHTGASRDALLRQGKTEQAIQSYLDAVTSPPSTPSAPNLPEAMTASATMRKHAAGHCPLVDAGDDYAAWQAGWTLFQRNAQRTVWPAARTVKSGDRRQLYHDSTQCDGSPWGGENRHSDRLVGESPYGNTNRTSSIRPVTSTRLRPTSYLWRCTKGICTWQSLARTPRKKCNGKSVDGPHSGIWPQPCHAPESSSTTSLCLATSPQGISPPDFLDPVT